MVSDADKILPLSQLFSLPIAAQVQPLSLPILSGILDDIIATQAVQSGPQPTPPYEPPQPDCACLFPTLQPECCIVPTATCVPQANQCNVPPYVPAQPVCGCDGNTYENACVALVENCVRCWQVGACSQ